MLYLGAALTVTTCGSHVFSIAVPAARILNDGCIFVPFAAPLIAMPTDSRPAPGTRSSFDLFSSSLRPVSVCLTTVYVLSFVSLSVPSEYV